MDEQIVNDRADAFSWSIRGGVFSQREIELFIDFVNKFKEFGEVFKGATNGIRDFTVAVDFGFSRHEWHLLERARARQRRAERAQAWNTATQPASPPTPATSCARRGCSPSPAASRG